MRIFEPSSLPVEPSDAAHFTGHASLTRMAGVSDRPAVNIYRVRFEPAARTAWHTHSGVQLLLVTDGRCRVQKVDEAVRVVPTGGIVCIMAGETHWHGAERDAAMTHVAINVDATTEWLEQVSDVEYAG